MISDLYTYMYIYIYSCMYIIYIYIYVVCVCVCVCVCVVKCCISHYESANGLRVTLQLGTRVGKINTRLVKK